MLVFSQYHRGQACLNINFNVTILKLMLRWAWPLWSILQLIVCIKIIRYTGACSLIIFKLCCCPICFDIYKYLSLNHNCLDLSHITTLLNFYVTLFTRSGDLLQLVFSVVILRLASYVNH